MVVDDGGGAGTSEQVASKLGLSRRSLSAFISSSSSSSSAGGNEEMVANEPANGSMETGGVIKMKKGGELKREKWGGRDGETRGRTNEKVA